MLSSLNGFVMCRASPYVQSGGMCVHGTGIERNRKLKFSMQTHLTHTNTIFKYFHASVILDIVDVLYLEGKNVLKNKTATVFFMKKLFYSSK